MVSAAPKILTSTRLYALPNSSLWPPDSRHILRHPRTTLLLPRCVRSSRHREHNLKLTLQPCWPIKNMPEYWTLSTKWIKLLHPRRSVRHNDRLRSWRSKFALDHRSLVSPVDCLATLQRLVSADLTHLVRGTALTCMIHLGGLDLRIITTNSLDTNSLV